MEDIVSVLAPRPYIRFDNQSLPTRQAQLQSNAFLKSKRVNVVHDSSKQEGMVDKDQGLFKGTVLRFYM